MNKNCLDLIEDKTIKKVYKFFKFDINKDIDDIMDLFNCDDDEMVKEIFEDNNIMIDLIHFTITIILDWDINIEYWDICRFPDYDKILNIRINILKEFLNKKFLISIKHKYNLTNNQVNHLLEKLILFIKNDRKYNQETKINIREEAEKTFDEYILSNKKITENSIKYFLYVKNYNKMFKYLLIKGDLGEDDGKDIKDIDIKAFLFSFFSKEIERNYRDNKDCDDYDPKSFENIIFLSLRNNLPFLKGKSHEFKYYEILTKIAIDLRDIRPIAFHCKTLANFEKNFVILYNKYFTKLFICYNKSFDYSELINDIYNYIL